MFPCILTKAIVEFSYGVNRNLRRKIMSNKADRFMNHDPSHAIIEFPRLDPAKRPEPDLVTRAAALALALGSANYLIVPEILEISRASSNDELSAFFTAAATAFFAAVRPVQALCEDTRGKGGEEALNIAAGAGGGITLGAAIAALTPAALASLLDGGIMFATTALGMGGAALRTTLRRRKLCPHCPAKGKCSQRICRACHRIFYPSIVKLDCVETSVLNWYQIASHLQAQGLSYFDSERLVREHMPSWKSYASGNAIVIDCESYRDWVATNKDKMLSYVNKGTQTESSESLNTALTKKGL
jgi:hypothetical protein